MTTHFVEQQDPEARFDLQPNTVVGFQYREDCAPARFAGKTVVRMGSVIYADTAFGADFQTGHNVVVRERTRTGHHVLIGTGTVLEGQITIGDFVKIESNCFIPTHVEIGNRVFIAPGVTLTNDRYPLKMRDDYVPEGPVLEDGVTLGAGVVVLPGVRIGQGSFVAAGAVVTKDIPPMSFVRGVPGKVSDLPENLRETNMALNWRHLLDPAYAKADN